MDYLPVAWRLKGQRVLLVGGGHIALRKARLLLRAGACLRVVAPEICAELASAVSDSGGSLHQRGFQPDDLADVLLVIAATDDEALNRSVSLQAQAAAIPVNVVDSPALSNFIFPAIVDRDPILVSISSGGASPVAARWVRSQIETLLPVRWGRIAALMGQYRRQLAERLPDVQQRRLFWEALLDGAFTEKVLAGQQDQAEALLMDAVNAADSRQPVRGEVYLVGAGPGDPDLLTFRALRLLQKADVVLYDRLIGRDILEFARRDADLVYVGKQRDEHVVSQQRINELLVDYARQGKKVCRLKGGDPFIFGRGGEELDQVIEAGIDFQVVPGITAASGCAAYAGIPLTHRDHAQSVRFITGHRKQNGALNLPWDRLVNPGETLVFYMGQVTLEEISQQLIAQGMNTDMPAALISKGTRRSQQVIKGTLESLPALVKQQDPPAPGLIIIGSVVGLYPRYRWFDSDFVQQQ